MTLPDDTAFRTITDLGRGLRSGEFTCVQLAEFCLERCETRGRELNAVVTLMRDRALRQAARGDEELKAGRDRGPLHGISCGIKDLLATSDYPTSWGAGPFAQQQLAKDATVVTRLEEAGAVLVAKLAMVEIAGGLGYKQANASFTGPGRNPWNPDRWSGGSSSGSGSAVGAGVVPFAIGTETWGSIMTPSALCGVTGLRPTYGRVSRHGAMALSWTMDKIGVLGRTAEDCGLVLNAIAGPDPLDDSTDLPPFEYPAGGSSLPQPLRLATVKGASDRVQPEVAANYEAALAVLRTFAEIGEIELDSDLPYNAVAATIISCEGAAAFEHLVAGGQIEEMAADEDRWSLWPDLLIPATDYIQALRIRRKIQRHLDDLLSGHHAIVTPTLSTVAGPIDTKFSAWSSGFVSTPIGGASNVAGLPAVSVPNGLGQDGLPTGLQFVGRAFDDARLIAVAHQFQRHTEWHRQRPAT